jgi:hypothetical protein
MGPELPNEPIGALPDEEASPEGDAHRVAPRRPDGPPMDEVLPPGPPDREHHGG